MKGAKVTDGSRNFPVQPPTQSPQAICISRSFPLHFRPRLDQLGRCVCGGGDGTDAGRRGKHSGGGRGSHSEEERRGEEFHGDGMRADR